MFGCKISDEMKVDIVSKDIFETIKEELSYDVYDRGDENKKNIIKSLIEKLENFMISL